MNKVKSLGREKAKENTFLSLGTRPEEYDPVYYKIFRQTANCQLCGQHIGYDFQLKHKTNSDKDLYVGSDCIVTFCKTYLPNIVESMLKKMELEMERLVEEEKAKVFSDFHPTFDSDYSRLEKSMREVLMKYNTKWEFVNGKKRLPIFETIVEARTDFRRKKYTTKPKVEAIYSAIKDLDSGDFEEKIKEYAESLESGKTVTDDINGKNKAVNEEFYNSAYFKYAKYMKWDQNPGLESKALSKIEKEIFLDQLQDYLASKSRLKKKIKKNKDEIIEKIRSQVIDPLKHQQIENGRGPFTYGVYDEESTKAVASHEAYVDLHSLYYGYGIRALFEEYGFRSLKMLQGMKNTDFVEICKPENFFLFKSTILLFKTSTDANNFVENVRDLIEGKITEINEYLNSDEVVNEKFN